MVIKPSQIHEDIDKARMGVGLAAKALEIEVHMDLQTMWLIKCEPEDLPTFVEFAQDFTKQS